MVTKNSSVSIKGESYLIVILTVNRMVPVYGFRFPSVVPVYDSLPICHHSKEFFGVAIYLFADFRTLFTIVQF